jgi:hypothetical protein
MGVEYRHFLIPANPAFVLPREAIMKVDRVLVKWRLKAGTPKVYNLENGENSIITAPIEKLDFGHGLAIKYPGVHGGQAGEIMGRSFYGEQASESDGYFEHLTLIGGMDYRIQPSNEELYVEVLTAPMENHIPIEKHDDNQGLLNLGFFNESYTSTAATKPPVVDISSIDDNRILGGQDFAGYWRTAFIMDCGKDLPGLSESFYQIPNREFINDVETALGCSVVEIGELY